MALLFMPNTFLQYIIVIETSQAVGFSPKLSPCAFPREWLQNGYEAATG
jgi:hypothetical protein